MHIETATDSLMRKYGEKAEGGGTGRPGGRRTKQHPNHGQHAGRKRYWASGRRADDGTATGNGAAAAIHPSGNLGLLMDVPFMSVEIEQTRRKLKEILSLNNGMVVELDKQADAPVDIIVNGQLIAEAK